MSRRKLYAVEYDRDYINLEDEEEIRRFVATMEEMHLKRRDENFVAKLLDEKNDEIWREEIRKYISEFAPPGCSNAVAVDCILNAAIRTISEKFTNRSPDTVEEILEHLFRMVEIAESKQIDAHDTQNPLNRIDYNSPEFAENARALCSLLGISIPDCSPIDLMEAACIYISENLNDDVLNEENDVNWKQPKMMDIKDFPLGMRLHKNGAINFSGRILRLLSLRQLKDIQTKINETLVAIQNTTIDMGKQADLKQVKYGKS